MQVKRSIFSLFLSLVSISAFSQFEAYTSFEALDSLSIEYYKSNNFDSAILVFEYARIHFPEKDEKATQILSYIYSYAKNDEKLLQTWDYGLKKRYFFGIIDWEYQHLAENPEFKRLLALDRVLADSLNQLAHVEHEVVLPNNYSKEKNYPVLFVFHGNNRNLEQAKAVWTSDLIHEKFICVYLQSCIHMQKTRYQWVSNDEKTNTEFRVIHDAVLAKYAVDKNKVIFLGMSAGGRQAIEYTFNHFVPVSDAILNCPVVPELSDTVLHAFAEDNKKLVIITGSKDWAYNSQKDLVQKIDSLGGKSRIIVNKDLGHQFAESFSSQLNEVLNWVLE